MLWVLKRTGSFKHPNHIFELMGKKILTILRLFFCLTGPKEMLLPAFYICCIYSNVLQTNFITEANTVNPDQTAPK